MSVCVRVLIAEERILSSASRRPNVREFSSSKLPVRHLGAKIDKELCPHEEPKQEV